MAEGTTELTPLVKIILAGTAGVLVFGGVVFGVTAYLDRNATTPLIILKADVSDYKKAPADKGGLKINSIDSPVLSLLDKAEELEEGVEILRPPVSEPEPPPIDVTAEKTPPVETQASAETASAETANAETANDETASAETASADTKTVVNTASDDGTTLKAEIDVITSSEEAETTVAPAEPIAVITEIDDQTNDQTGTDTTATVSTENVDPEDEITSAVNSLPQKKPNTPKIVTTTDINSPLYVVQFAAFKNETSAKNTAAVLSTKHKSRLNGMALGYMRWGNYWRVVAEPMPRAEANAFCSKFRSVGQDCIIKFMENPNG